MATFQPAVGQHVFLSREGFVSLVNLLRDEGYTVIGPTVAQGVIALREIESAEQLANGVRDEQRRGSYRLMPASGDLQFQFVVGADSPKRYLFPPSHRIFKVRAEDGRLVFTAGPPQPPKMAMVGIRPCELAGIQVSDRVFTGRSRCETDSYYTRARAMMMTVVVNCTRPGGNCFCSSMGTGPSAKEGFDLALTELRGGFLMKVGSARGAQISGRLDIREPSPAEMELADLRLELARERMEKSLNTSGIVELLAKNLEHPRYAETARRCLGCGNCTMVCPTCFCSSVVDSSDVAGGEMGRTRLWESCFTHQFSYTTAGPIRPSIRARYRHWLRHKLATYWEQFGCSGCVGCGRCITWCPVGIDLTEEVEAIRATAAPAGAEPKHKKESEVA